MALDRHLLTVHYGRMAGKKLELGATGEVVARNITRLKKSAGLNYTQLSERLTGLGRPINPVGVRRIEDQDRRVDVDDLVALAVALGVSPISLLMPDVEKSDQIAITGRAEPVDARLFWAWLRAEQPLGSDQTWPQFISVAWPRWVQEQFNTEAREQLQKSLFNFGPGGDSGGDD